MPANCQEDVRLPSGKTLQPDDALTLADLCEIFPALLTVELQQMKNACGPEAQGPRAQAGPALPAVKSPAPGQGIQVASRALPPGFQDQRAGAPVPSLCSIFGGGQGGGPSTGPGGGPAGGGGFSGGSGGGRRGPQGPQGPAGVGATIPAPIVKTDGDFTVGSASPFVAVPGTSLAFTTTRDGITLFFLQAGIGDISSSTHGQVGLRIDGVDYPLTPTQNHTFVSDVGILLVSGVSFWALQLAAGDHTVEVIVRGDAALPGTTGLPITVQANTTSPLLLSVLF